MQKAPVHVKISEATKKRAQLKAIRDNTTLTNVVAALLGSWVDGTITIKKTPSSD